MAKPEPIFIDEWLEELTRVQPQSAEGFTRRDVQRVLKLGEHSAGERIRQWIERGLTEYAGKRHGMTIDGRPYWFPVYRMTRKDRKKSNTKINRRTK